MSVNKDDFLYIFLHIPKCGGSTFMRHLLYNFPQKAIFELPGVEHFKHRAAVDERINRFTPAQKDEIRLICGHGVYHGIHQHFQREPRYFTFMRNPAARAISNFNFFMKYFDDSEEYDKDRYGRIKADITFDNWWDKFQQNLQVGVVLNYQIDDRPGWDPELALGDSDLERAKRALDDFYFVGLTETLDEDSLYLYGQMECSRLLRHRQNVTGQKYVELTDELRERIWHDSALDVGLYQHSVDLNRRFKATHPDFSACVERMRAGARYVTPVKYQIVEALWSTIGVRNTMLLAGAVSGVVKPIVRRFR